MLIKLEQANLIAK